MYDLPPLHALRAFEAAARHLSIKEAAAELFVTPGAVSQLIKSLETSLGIKLFARTSRSIQLTETGRSYLPPIRNAFRQIGEATHRATASVETGILTVSVTPFFASAWLVPRLASFHESYPHVDLHIETTTRLVDFARDGVDVAIRHGLGLYPGLVSDHVLAVEVVPVASPVLVKKHGKPKKAVDLASWPLVHEAQRKGWHRWFAAQGLVEIGAPRGPSYDDSAVLLDAVRAGQGAGLMPAAVVAKDIKARRLVPLSKAALISEIAYYLVCPEAARDRPKIAAFRKWVLAAARPNRRSSKPRA